ncbi:MAG: cupin domain-containing protein [Actinobacteria bacterium]|nr:cupin domain-containing protein [Actinomycetota bacterium]
MSEKPLNPEGVLAQYAAERKVSRRYAFKAPFSAPGTKPEGPYTWNGVKVERYKPEGDDWSGIIRQVIVGYREQTTFHVRYFEIAPGGNSSLEKHVHAHAVIGVRGEGKVIVGPDCYQLGFLDAVYVSPDTPHQLVNTGDQPFGFLCIVDAERDRPRPVNPDELKAILESPRTRDIVRPGKLNLEKVEGA